LVIVHGRNRDQTNARGFQNPEFKPLDVAPMLLRQSAEQTSTTALNLSASYPQQDRPIFGRPKHLFLRVFSRTYNLIKSHEPFKALLAISRS